MAAVDTKNMQNEGYSYFLPTGLLDYFTILKVEYNPTQLKIYLLDNTTVNKSFGSSMSHLLHDFGQIARSNIHFICIKAHFPHIRIILVYDLRNFFKQFILRSNSFVFMSERFLKILSL